MEATASSTAELPPGWSECRFTAVTVTVPVAYSKVKQADYLGTGQFPVVGQGRDLVGGYTDRSDKLVDCELPVIVFGDHTKAIKHVDFPFAAGADGIKVIQPRPGLWPKYLFYLLQAVGIPDRGYSRHYQFLRALDLPVAPLPEQHRIVEAIEAQVSRLDAAVAGLKRAQANLARYKASVLQAACEGRLVPTEAERARQEGRDYEPADVLLERTNSAELVGKPAVYRSHHPEATFASYLIRVPLFEGYLPGLLSGCINSVIGRTYIASVVS